MLPTLEGEPVTKFKNKEEAIIDLVQLVLLGICKTIHNDIKPDNVVKYDGHFFLIDYGISLLYHSFNGNQCFDKELKPIKSKSVLTTPLYDSPEKAKDGCVSPKSDLYSLGVYFFY
ncbi:predicted protein [Naegleria gruberi]|uniref:non-specific serine/threonine protein kinase n=1 Tax=Naegleria gruberi TaxID=5762 RepID=D2VYZ3_NAEGR|nr:uncharacterized protein NAEGRDRAFT_74296 [Naegleria gruberi]EFC37993.1 predicted protein [Naegleria gruberi]|eukprot:XP_002670737.1 predicted protein [Naegleria gruberi strain NEG-M]